MKRILFLFLLLNVTILFPAVELKSLPLQTQYFPEQFGKTHFIVGFPHEQLDAVTKTTADKKTEKLYKQADLAHDKPILFSPDDDLAAALVRIIQDDWRTIRVAIFTFTHDDIAQALIDAHKRGVVVEVITDPGYKADRYSKIHLLKEEGIRVFEYDPEYIQDRRSNIMHHKFVIFESSDNNYSLVWMGSFNFTRAADDRNQESVVKLQGQQAAECFNAQFERMQQQRCVNCKKKSHKIACRSHKKSNKRNKKTDATWLTA